jgi:hypothetical protein
MPTTAAQQSVTTGTAIKTMLQIGTPSDMQIQVLEWGYSIDDYPGADSVIELLQTDVAATVTAHVAAGVVNLDPNGPASRLSMSTTTTGYTASAEGTTTAARVFDAVSIDTTAGSNAPLERTRTFMPDDRPIVGVSKFLRVRATTPTTAVDMRCWVLFNQL